MYKNLKSLFLLLMLVMCFSVVNAQDDNKQRVDPLKTKVDKMPMFPGGTQALLEYLKDNVNYPIDAEKKKKSGRVLVTFDVDTDGNVVDVEVVKSVWPSLDAEALRVVKSMPKWRPGIKDGKAVRIRYTLPITFRLK